jgi:tetratricopeptide (TPR) repeat protein
VEEIHGTNQVGASDNSQGANAYKFSLVVGLRAAMSSSPTVFVSYSGKDLKPVQKLILALKFQNVNVWDYTDKGQELDLGRDKWDLFKKRIDECEYFIAVITANSIDDRIGVDPRFEVRYAIDSGKARQNRILPILINNPPDEWMNLYSEIAGVLRPLSDNGDDALFENNVRRICKWLDVRYELPSLKRAFFGDLFLKEAQSFGLDMSPFLRLANIMNKGATKYLEKDWHGWKRSANLFLEMANDEVPNIEFLYPQIILGLAQLEIGELHEAEKTFLKVSKKEASLENLRGLGLAGLGHTYFLMERFEESLQFFEKALEIRPNDTYLLVNRLNAKSAVTEVTDTSPFALLKPETLTAEQRLRITGMKVALYYKQGKYSSVLDELEPLPWSDLDEPAALYYARALMRLGHEDEGISVLTAVAERTGSLDLFHCLANGYLSVGDVDNAINVYRDLIRLVTDRNKNCGDSDCESRADSDHNDFARQLLVEFAQLVRMSVGENDEFFKSCETVIADEILGVPQTRKAFFFVGFAYHLSGCSDLARHYFDKSSGYSAQYYDVLEPQIQDDSD